MASRKRRRNRSATSVHRVKQALDTHTTAGPSAAARPPAAPRDPRGDPRAPHRHGGCPAPNAPAGLGRGFKALVSRCSAGSAERGRKGAHAPPGARAPGGRGGPPPGSGRGPASRCRGNRRGAVPAGPGFGAAFWLGGAAPTPPSPVVRGRPAAGSPPAASPTAPPRENGLWIEGDKLDFMKPTGRPTTHFGGGRGAGRAAAVFRFLVSNS